MDKELRKDLKRRANEMKAQFNLGKNGLTLSYIELVDKYLEAHGMVKIKVTSLKDKVAVSEFANELSKKTNSIIVEEKGFTLVLYRRKSKK